MKYGMSDPSNIVIVDDDTGMLLLMRTLVTQAFPQGRVAEFGSARLALERIREGMISLVISDCAMPEMDGFALVRAIRAGNSAVPILMVSGTRDMEKAAMEAGATRYLGKDRVMLELGRCVRELLGVDEGPGCG